MNLLELDISDMEAHMEMDMLLMDLFMKIQMNYLYQ